MAYHEGPLDQVRARIRSTRGETIDLALPDTCSVGELRSFLIEEYQYNPSTRLLFNGTPADEAATVTSYPYGSLLIATPADMTELARQQQRHPAPQQSAQAGQALPQGTTAARGGRGASQHVHQQPIATPKANESPGKQTRIPQHQSHMAAQLHRNHAHTPSQTTNQPAAQGRSRSTEEAKPATQRPAQTPAQKAGPRTGGASPPHQSSLPLRRGSTTAVGGESTAVGAAANGAPPPAESASAPQNPPSMPQQPPQPQQEAQPSQPSPPQQQQQQQHQPAKPESQSQQAQPPAQQPPAQQPPAQQPPAHQPPTQQPPAQQPPPQQQPQQPQQPQEQPENPNLAPDFAHWREISFTVECVIPALETVVQLQVTADCSVAALALAITEAVPQLRGMPFQLVLRGKILQQTESNILFKIGMRGNCRVYVACGAYTNIDVIMLLEIKEELGVIEDAVSRPLTDEKRKGYYEELMRMLLRTDGLQNLEGEWRKSRKDTVAQIQRLQDSLGIQIKY